MAAHVSSEGLLAPLTAICPALNPDVNGFWRVGQRAQVERNGKIRHDRRFYLSSLPLDAIITQTAWRLQAICLALSPGHQPKSACGALPANPGPGSTFQPLSNRGAARTHTCARAGIGIADALGRRSERAGREGKAVWWLAGAKRIYFPVQIRELGNETFDQLFSGVIECA
jgi:hypothetical protein